MCLRASLLGHPPHLHRGTEVMTELRHSTAPTYHPSSLLFLSSTHVMSRSVSRLDNPAVVSRTDSSTASLQALRPPLNTMASRSSSPDGAAFPAPARAAHPNCPNRYQKRGEGSQRCVPAIGQQLEEALPGVRCLDAPGKQA